MWSGFPYVIQAALLGCFLALGGMGVGWIRPGRRRRETFCETHLTTLLIWGVCWPAMLWAAVLLALVGAALLVGGVFLAAREWRLRNAPMP